ncbi:cell wall metabolism sensor histidine kinase WalK [Bacillus sp. X1(2014)]|uniref:sensor histidine kinase n=1 Tax=Bacillus sp. X1(2014) TaxID=1565991 RepID=UPI0021B21FD2|nr:HAMP domain-containing histidine kinase [Bacillus sp. X1(2014)]
MGTKIGSFIRAFTKQGEKDIFRHTQGRLTRMYSGLLMLFLILFIAIVYIVLHVVILNNQERELQSLVNQEASFIENSLLKNEHSDLKGIDDQEVVFAGVNQFFYYLVNANGEIIMGNESDKRMRQNILRLINGRMQNEGEIRKETVHAEMKAAGRGMKGEFHPRETSQDIQLIIANRSIYNNGQFIGKLYVGKDISFAYQLFRSLLMILITIGIVFLGIAIYMSVVMSKRAMIPISGAFTRQREFVADASHELRTPLSVLLSSIDAVEMTIEPQKRDMVEKILTNMRQEVKRMTHLVSDLLTLARSDSNTIQLSLETFDFRPQAERAIDSVRPLAAAKQISLHLDSPDSLIAVGDPGRLSQLLYILLDNAIKYTTNGGEVVLALKMEGQQLCLSVQDTGIGISVEDCKHIFERFYRSDKSRSRQMGGHGLGLSIAKWIVDTHKGTIKVTSELGKGSTFIVYIPLVFKG